MSKKEKIIAIIFTISFFMVIFSSIYTIVRLRPKSGFVIEKIIPKNLFKG